MCREASPFVGDQAGRLMIPSGRDEVRPWLYIGFLIKSFVQKQAGPSGEPRWSGAWVLVGSNETCSSDKGGDCQRGYSQLACLREWGTKGAIFELKQQTQPATMGQICFDLVRRGGKRPTTQRWPESITRRVLRWSLLQRGKQANTRPRSPRLEIRVTLK